MSNETADRKELLLLNEATGVFTREALNKVFHYCDKLLEDDLPQSAKEAIAELDAECCKLLRNRLLLSRIIKYRLEEPKTRVCSFSDVFMNCCATVNAICLQEKVEFSFSNYYPESRIPLSADECCLLLMLPIAISCMEKDRKDMGVRLIASKHGSRLQLEYVFKSKVSDIFTLAEECKKTDGSSGVFFPNTLMAFSLLEAVAQAKAIMTVKNDKTLIISVELADDKAALTSFASPYIDNRFSLPYIMLADIVKREV